MKSQITNRQAVQFVGLRAPIVACLILGAVGCASGSRPSITSFWKRKPASETESKEKEAVAKSERKGNSETPKKPAVKSSGEVAESRSKAKSDGAKKSGTSASKSDSRDDETAAMVSSSSERRDRIRSYLKDQDEKKTDVAKSSIGDEEKPIRRVSKSDFESDEGVLPSLSSRKKKTVTDPFLDEEDEDPIAAASRLSNKSPLPTGKRLRDLPAEDSPESMSDLDREMAELGLKKQQSPDEESIDRLESLLESSEDEQPAESPSKSTKRISKTIADSESNPFEDLDESSPTATKVSKQEVARKATPKSSSDEIPDFTKEDQEVPETKRDETKFAEAKFAGANGAESDEAKPVAKPKSVATKAKTVPSTPRQQADDLVLQALAKMKKNQFEEACELTESAARIEEEHQLEYGPGEERPTKLLSQLQQLRDMLANETHSTKPAATKKSVAPVIKPNPVSLPSLSNDLLPADDETASLEGSEATQVSFTQSEEGTDEAQVTVASGAGGEAEPAADSNPFEDLGSPATGEAPEFKAETKPVTASAERATLSAPSPSEIGDVSEEMKPSVTRGNNSLGMLLVGVSLISLGCAGVFVWRAMRPSGVPGPAEGARREAGERKQAA